MVTKLKQQTATEFLAAFDPSVHAPIRELAALEGTTHLVKFENLQLDSSQAGACTAIAIGPTRTFKTLDEVGGRHINDLPSQRQYAVAYVPAEELVEPKKPRSLGAAATPASYIGQVKTPGDKDWVGNALRFATHAEAEAYVKNLASRWTLVRETNVAESTDAPTHGWRDGTLVDLPQPVLDVTVNNQGTIVALTLNTDAAVAWVDENVSSEGWQWLGERTLCVEPRYAHDLVDGLGAAGLTVGV